MSDESAFKAQLERQWQLAQTIKRRAMATFPLRVWQNFSFNNGFLLSAGVSYYILFALFALLYVLFAGAGIWLNGSPEAVDALITVINGYLPGIIGSGDNTGLVSREELVQVTHQSTGVLGVTGAVAVGVGIWTAIGVITFFRRAIRDVFGLPFDRRGYWRLKLADAIAAALFGATLLLGSVLSWAGVWALEQFRDLVGLEQDSLLQNLVSRGAAVIIIFIIDAVALAMLVRFLTGTKLTWPVIWPGALLGGAAVAVLQLGLGLLLAHTPGNPLLATFTVIIGLLLWCRWVAMVVLMATSLIAVIAADRDEPLSAADSTSKPLVLADIMVMAAREKLERAEDYAVSAPWYQRPAALRRVRKASEDLAHELAMTKDDSPV